MLAICVITVEEIERGLGRMPQGRRRTSLEARWKAHLHAFVDTIALFDVAAAQATAAVLVQAESLGRSIGHVNAQIAGICFAHGHDLATRNVKDFAYLPGLTIIDPFGPPV